jgi:hypothetical protein
LSSPNQSYTIRTATVGVDMIEAEAPSYVALYAAAMALIRPAPAEYREPSRSPLVGVIGEDMVVKLSRRGRAFGPTISEFIFELETQQARWNDRLNALSDLREKHALATTMIEKAKEEAT